MKTKDKSTLFILAGAVVAGIAGWYLTNSYINTEVVEHKRAFQQQQQTVDIVVAAYDLKVGDIISLKNAQSRSIPKTYVGVDAVLPKDFAVFLEGRQLKHNLRAGEPILKIHASNLKVEGLSSLLAPGERAITIPVQTEDTISGFLKPGDVIDLFVTLKDGALERTAPLLQKIRVLATGIDVDDGIEEKNQKNFNEITLAVTPMQATKLIHSQAVGELAVLLRRHEDKSSDFDDYVTIDNLVETKQAVSLPPEPPPPPPPPMSKTGNGFELIRGGNKS